jgi:glycosyltransferase involved in cell wall biosynthesis
MATDEKLLTVIVPITRMAGRLQKLQSWISSPEAYQLHIVLIHDINDSQTGMELSQIVNQLKRQDIILIEGKFGSPGNARNAGLPHIRTPWVSFWDSDDMPEVTKFLAMVEKANLSGGNISVGNFSVYEDSSGNKIGVNEILPNWEFSIALNPGIWRFTFKSKIISEIKFTNYRVGEDQLFILETLQLGFVPIIYPETVYNYYVGDPWHQTTNQTYLFDLIEVLKIVIMKLKVGPRKTFAEVIAFRMILTLLRRGHFKCKVHAATLAPYVFWALVGPRKSISILSSLARGPGLYSKERGL